MKNLMHFALAILLFCSCRKVDQDLVSFNKVVPENAQSAGVQNLGHVFSGTNINWKLHPLNAGNNPLFTTLPNRTDGYCLVMIDNGNLDGLTPINAFRFVVVDLQSKTSKIVPVKAADGNAATYSLGRVVTGTFGLDKKYYVATQGSPSGGGHLIQYDPATQSAVDLGKPFKNGASALDIYTLNVGTDGALYGGSFGGEGDVFTFRYDYKRIVVDATPLDNTSRYVTSVSGDSRYTYAVGGKNNCFLYAIDRQTGEKRTLKSFMGSSVSIDIASNTDAPYAHSGATHYRLSGLGFTALKEYDRPMTERVYYVPYAETDPTVPQVLWSDVDRQVTYKLANGQTGSIAVNGLQEDIYSTTGPMMYYNDKLYLVCYKQGLMGTYAPGEGFKKIGSSTMGIQSLLVAPAGSPEAGKIFLSGYPKGGLLQFSPSQPWNVNIAGFTNTNNGFATSTSNPRATAYFQNPDASGINGAMSLMGIEYTRSGYIAGAGNNDRITTSAGRELSIGSFKNGSVRNLYLPEFANYTFQTMCLSKDSNYAFIGAVPRSGNVTKLYKYDPAANRIVASWDVPLWGDDLTCSYQVIDEQTLAGYCCDSVFLFDLKTGQVTWKGVTGRGQKIYSIAKAPDGSILITHMYLSALDFRIVKYTFDLSDRANIKATSTLLAELQDQDLNERTKPTGMLVVKNNNTTNYDIYISGLNSLYRIKV